MAVGVHIGVTVDVSEGDEADGLAKFGLYLYTVDNEQTCGFYGEFLLLAFLTSRSFPVLTAWQAWQSI